MTKMNTGETPDIEVPELYMFRVVAIDRQDGITVRDNMVVALTRDEAEAKFLQGNFYPGPEIGTQETPFLDVNPAEYIKCIEPFGLERTDTELPPEYREKHNATDTQTEDR